MTTIVIVECIWRVVQCKESSIVHYYGLVKDALHQIFAAPIMECQDLVRLLPVYTTDYIEIRNCLDPVRKTQPWN